MGWGMRRIRNHEMTEDAARGAMSGSGGLATALVSGFALIFSGLSLYETVLKRASLKIYVPRVVHYAREPGGDVELFAIPITIANHGARDAAVTSIRATVRGVGKPESEAKAFFSAYFIGAPFFAKGRGFDRTTKRIERNPRPKQPFAPIAVAGRGAYTGTILFNVVGKTFPQAVTEAGEYVLTVRLETEINEGFGPADRFLSTTAKPITMTVRLNSFSRQRLSFGGLARMHDVTWDRKSREAGTQQ